MGSTTDEHYIFIGYGVPVRDIPQRLKPEVYLSLPQV